MSAPKSPDGHFTVLYFAAAASLTGKSFDHISAPMKVSALFDSLSSIYPGIKEKVLHSCALTVNLDYVDAEADADIVIKEGDEVAIIPPVSSG